MHEFYQPGSGVPENGQAPGSGQAFAPHPGYVEEKRRLRRAGNLFGVATLLYFAVSVAFGLLFGFLISLIYQITGRHLFGNSEVSYYLLNIAAYVLSFALPFSAYVSFVKMPWRVAVPWKRVRVGTVLLSIPAAFGLSVVGTILTSVLSSLFSLTGYQPVVSDMPLPVTTPGLVLYFIQLAVLPAVLEEIAFRGILMQSLRRFGDWFALLVSSLMFGLFHLNMVQAPYAFLLGLWFGFLVLRTGSLRISMVLHGCINLSAGLMTLWLNGMPENWVLVVNLVYIVFWLTTGIAGFLFLALRARGPLQLYPAQSWMRTGQRVGVYLSSVGMILALLAILFFMLQNFERIV